MADRFEDDAFWTTFGPIQFGANRNAAAPSDIDGFSSLTDLAAGARVLHSLELAQRGIEVVAPDRTKSHLDTPRLICLRDRRDYALTAQSVPLHHEPWALWSASPSAPKTGRQTPTLLTTRPDSGSCVPAMGY